MPRKSRRKSDFLTDPQTVLNLHRLELRSAITGLLRTAFLETRADEGTLWLLDPSLEALIPVWNSGANAAHFVGHYRQPLQTGLISLVCVSGQALCENSVYQNAGQDPTLDRQLGVLTCSMIAVPLKFRGEIRGVISCVKLKPANTNTPDPEGFTPEDLVRIGEAARLFKQNEEP